MGANRYSCENSFGAIKLPLWRTYSHNMAISPNFLAFLVTFLAVMTPVLESVEAWRRRLQAPRLNWPIIFALSA